jgi:hypothetical protein
LSTRLQRAQEFLKSSSPAIPPSCNNANAGHTDPSEHSTQHSTPRSHAQQQAINSQRLQEEVQRLLSQLVACTAPTQEEHTADEEAKVCGGGTAGAQQLVPAHQSASALCTALEMLQQQMQVNRDLETKLAAFQKCALKSSLPDHSVTGNTARVN